MKSWILFFFSPTYMYVGETLWSSLPLSLTLLSTWHGRQEVQVFVFLSSCGFMEQSVIAHCQFYQADQLICAIPSGLRLVGTMWKRKVYWSARVTVLETQTHGDAAAFHCSVSSQVLLDRDLRRKRDSGCLCGTGTSVWSLLSLLWGRVSYTAFFLPSLLSPSLSPLRTSPSLSFPSLSPVFPCFPLSPYLLLPPVPSPLPLSLL